MNYKAKNFEMALANYNRAISLYSDSKNKESELNDIIQKATAKKPKGRGRRLYTDENPRDTVPIKFATPADARRTVAKVKKVNKPFARRIQILTVVEQRAKVAGKPQQAAIAKRGKEAIRRKHGKKKG